MIGLILVIAIVGLCLNLAIYYLASSVDDIVDELRELRESLEKQEED